MSSSGRGTLRSHETNNTLTFGCAFGQAKTPPFALLPPQYPKW